MLIPAGCFRSAVEYNDDELLSQVYTVSVVYPLASFGLVVALTRTPEKS